MYSYIVIDHKVNLFLYVCLSHLIIYFDASTKGLVLKGKVCIASNT